MNSALGRCCVPEALGGVGLGPVELALVFEAAGRALAPLPITGQAAAIAALLASEDPELTARCLDRVMIGPKPIVAIDEDGLAPYGMAADLVLSLGDQRASLHGLEPRTNRSDGIACARRHGAARSRPAPRRYAASGRRRRRARTVLLCLAALAVGGAGEALDRTVAFGLERRQFGRPVGSFQAYKHRLADRAVDVEQARSALWWAAASLAENPLEARSRLARRQELLLRYVPRLCGGHDPAARRVLASLGSMTRICSSSARAACRRSSVPAQSTVSRSRDLMLDRAA